jgi:hypothetical protein
MKTSLTIENGKKAYLDSLHQWRTYGGLLEGIPTDKMNANILERVLVEAKHHTYTSAIFVIKPEQVPIPYDGKYPFGNPMQMPATTCVASLTCLDTARNHSMDGSALTIVWYQENFAFPIEEAILESIKQITWSQLAEDFEY